MSSWLGIPVYGALVRLITPVYETEQLSDAETRLQAFTRGLDQWRLCFVWREGNAYDTAWTSRCALTLPPDDPPYCSSFLDSVSVRAIENTVLIPWNGEKVT